jgi:hypothetical protein
MSEPRDDGACRVLADAANRLPQELIFGTLRVADAPLPNHQRAVAQLFLALNAHVTKRRGGEVWLSPIDVILDAPRHLLVRPDLLFISNERSYIVGDRIRGGPISSWKCSR